ncbi:MAG: hypothetical protein ACO2O2_08740 [Acidilobaceae archaeon]
MSIAFCNGAWVVLGQIAYYYLDVGFAKYLMPVFEIPLFVALLGVALVAAGIRVPFITVEGEPF